MDGTTASEVGNATQRNEASHTQSGEHGGELKQEANSDDDTLATARSLAEAHGKDRKPSSILERIRSAPQAVRKKLRLRDAAFQGPSKSMHPTSAKLRIQANPSPRRRSSAVATGKRSSSPTGSTRDFEVMWRSRDDRKGSTAVPVSPRGGSITMRLMFSSRDIGHGLWRMLTTFKYWDISWWSGFTYSIGSALFVIDGFWAWLPLGWPSTEFVGESKYGVPLAFFFGALFFQVGAVMAYLEAINDGSFAGSAMRRLLLGHDKEAQEILDKKLADFIAHFRPGHHGQDNGQRREKSEGEVDPEAGWRAMNDPEMPQSRPAAASQVQHRRGGLDLGELDEGETVEYTRWRWWPTWHRLRTHHIYEIGYLSCTIQLVGVTLYGVTAIVILPGVFDTLTHQWQLNWAYWIPQIVAASCFLIASFGFTFETQSKFWRPEPGVLGWWIGVWSIIGSVGFL
jgi:hypothetical protein